MTGSPWNRREREVRALHGISRDRHPETGIPETWQTTEYDRYRDAMLALTPSRLESLWWRAQGAWDRLTRWLYRVRQVWRRSW